MQQEQGSHSQAACHLWHLGPCCQDRVREEINRESDRGWEERNVFYWVISNKCCIWSTNIWSI